MRHAVLLACVLMISCSQDYLDKAAKEPGAIKTSSGLIIPGGATLVFEIELLAFRPS